MIPPTHCHNMIVVKANKRKKRKKRTHIKGVIGLAKGLRKVKSKHHLVVAVLPDVPVEHRKMLVDEGCVIREIELLYPPENQTQFALPYFVINYSKLGIWEFVEYNKMIYLDGDIQVFDNIDQDHLFDLPNGGFYAVMDCFCDKTWNHSVANKIGYGQQCHDRVKWPEHELGPKPPLYFNAGMFVFEPRLATYHDLLKSVKTTSPTPFAEQHFLNMDFKDIYKPLPPIHNLMVALIFLHGDKIELEKVKVVHYCADGSKPWEYNGEGEYMDRDEVKILVNKWWEIYRDKSLDYINFVGSEEMESGNLQPPVTKARVMHKSIAPSAA